MSLKFTFAAATGQFQKAFDETYKPLAEAGTEAIKATALEVKTKARADIAAAGFGKLWQNALRVDTYPKRGVSLNAAALVYHKIPYADIFESGGTIHGKPRLWLPLSTTPPKLGRFRTTPQKFIQSIGRLTFVKRPGKNPLLFAKMTVSEGQAKSGKFGKTTLVKLRQGAAGQGIVRAVPVFVGINSVKIRDRFSIREIIARAVDELPGVYLEKVSRKGLD